MAQVMGQLGNDLEKISVDEVESALRLLFQRTEIADQTMSQREYQTLGKSNAVAAAKTLYVSPEDIIQVEGINVVRVDDAGDEGNLP